MTTTKEKTRHERVREIEHKHLGRCIDQIWAPGRRALIERIELIDYRKTIITVKVFERSVPKNSAADWPELAGFDVYLPIEDDMTFEGLDRALGAYRERLTAREGGAT